MPYTLINNGGGKPSGQQQGGKEPKETFWPKLGRNVVKAGTLGYAALRSGLGVGDIERAFQEEAVGMSPEQSAAMGNIGSPFTTFEEARKEAEKGISGLAYLTGIGSEKAKKVAKYSSEQRPGDVPYELAAQELMTLPFSGINAAGGALKYGAKTAARLGAGYLGGKVGESVGEKVGMPRLGQAAGAIGAGTTAGWAAERALPKRAMGKDIFEAEKATWETERAGKVEQVNQQHLPQINEANELEKQALLNIAKTKDAHSKQIETEVAAANKQLSDYNAKMEELALKQKETYKRAEESRTGTEQGSAENLLNVAEQTKKRLGRGGTPSDEAALGKIITDIRKNVKGKKGKKTITLQQIDDIEKNINSQVYGGERIDPFRTEKTTPRFKAQVKPIQDALHELLQKTGDPEHSTHYLEAQELTSELGKMRRDLPELENQVKKQVSDIRRKSIPAEQEAQMKLQHREAAQKQLAAKQAHKEALKGLGPESYEQMLKQKAAEDVIHLKFMDIPMNKLRPYAAPAFGAAIGLLHGGGASAVLGSFVGLAQKIGSEYKYLRKAMVNHPEIVKDYGKLLAQSSKMSAAHIASRMNILADKSHKLAKHYEQEEKGKGRYKLIKRG